MEDLESIRRMTPDQKLQQWRALVRSAWTFFEVPDAETGRKKWEAWEREHERGNLSLIRGLLEIDREPAPGGR